MVFRPAALLALSLAACTPPAPSGDAALPDAFTPLPDGAVPPDGGSPTEDGGPRPVDAGTDAGPRLPDPCIAMGTCAPGRWVNVTPPEMDTADLDYGPGPVVVDPARPSDLYAAGGGAGVWRSTDYGNTWTQINTDIDYVPMGLVIAVAGTTPATVWVAGYNVVYRSSDGGVSFEQIEIDLPAELYSIVVDPHDDDHLISGLHEADGIVESVDGGRTWRLLDGSGFPAGGVSWYPFFVETGDAAARDTWIAIAQNDGGVAMTRDGGDSWTIPRGIEGLVHPHGNAQIFQHGASLWVGGIGGPGDGMYRSTDLGVSFTRVWDHVVGVTWGTESAVYAMWGWACSGCDLGASFASAPLPAGDTWELRDGETPPELLIGANHVAVTSDGTHDVFVGTMWSQGLWRYVVP
jgi:photosystem II stability/assembly factor-like uncharacterized protein